MAIRLGVKMSYVFSRTIHHSFDLRVEFCFEFLAGHFAHQQPSQELTIAESALSINQRRYLRRRQARPTDHRVQVDSYADLWKLGDEISDLLNLGEVSIHADAGYKSPLSETF